MHVLYRCATAAHHVRPHPRHETLQCDECTHTESSPSPSCDLIQSNSSTLLVLSCLVLCLCLGLAREASLARCDILCLGTVGGGTIQGTNRPKNVDSKQRLPFSDIVSLPKVTRLSNRCTPIIALQPTAQPSQ